ncbi:MAG: xanthine dehydrogenase subunit D [Acidimicrobiia bacterium]
MFAYSSDLYLDNMLWGATVRSPHPRARILGIDISHALTIGGVATVLTAEDVPGDLYYGMKEADQPVLASDQVRYQGEPVAIVAADHPETARRAAAAISVDYEELPPLTDSEVALDPETEPIHPNGNVARHVRIRHGDVEQARRRAEVVVAGEYETGMQDPAFLGPESGLAVPDGSGGVELFVAAQWIHDDQRQIAASLGLPESRVRVVLAGVGGAFGGREDLSMHVHACMLALRTGRPIRMSYSRDESFVGHVHRHPARMRIEQGATRDGQLVFTKARLVFDGGAYTSTSKIVIANGSYFAAGAYQVENVEIDGFAVYTNNPPSGAMRGFGAVQSCYAIESSMDRLAGALQMDPLELRRRNAVTEGTILPTGQPVDGPAPVVEMLDYLRDLPLPPEPTTDGATDLRQLPGGVGNTTHGEGIKRGVGYALGMKAIGFSGGVDDYSTARVTVSVSGGSPVVEVYTAAAECGQGIVGVQAQIARTELGISDVVVIPADTDVGDAGSSSASRQTWMSGGAVQGACQAVRQRLLQHAAAVLSRTTAELAIEDGAVVEASDGEMLITLADLLGAESVSAEHEYHHRPTEPIDDERGQGDAHIAFAYAAHRAVVDVDTELGLVKVVELATAQDVGKAMNPQAVEGQIEGGSAQGLGLAILEEVQLDGGVIQNPSFTDYLIPTILDMPPMRNKIFEFPHPDSPYGLNGVGEPPTLSSTPAIANALRDATGLELPRVPVRPTDLISDMNEEAT